MGALRMDYCWIATRKIESQKVYGALSLSETLERDDAMTAPYCAVELPSGVFVVQTSQEDENFMDTETVEALSEDGEAFLCMVSEESMMTILMYCRDGEAQWLISHDGEQGPDHLDVEGELPEIFSELRQDLQERASKDEEPVEFFTLPVDLGLALTGYQGYGDVPGIVPGSVRVLALQPTLAD